MVTTAQPARSAGKERTRFYALENFYLKSGSQPGRINEFMSKALLPMISKIHAGPKIFLEALVAPHMPQFALILGFRSAEELWSLHRTLGEQAEFQKAVEIWERDPEPPYEHCSLSLLEATGYSPEIVVPSAPSKLPRVFELRTYHSPTSRQLRALHERFSGPEIKIFHRCGIHPLFYTTMIFGANLPNLTYLIPFENLAVREKAWAAFGADPEWVKVRKESIEKHGQISSVIQIGLFRPTTYSPVR